MHHLRKYIHAKVSMITSFIKSIDVRKNRFTLERARSRQYPAQTITDVDYADDIALEVNTPARDESILYSLEKAATGIGLHVNEEKRKYMSLIQNQGENIFTIKGGYLKRVDKFTYTGISLSSMKNDINT